MLSLRSSDLATADLVKRVAEVAHEVERVEDDTRWWRMAPERGANGLPPVPRGKLEARRLVCAQRGKEEVPVGFGAARPADPEGPAFDRDR